MTLRANSPLVRRARLRTLMGQVTLLDDWDDTDLAREMHCSLRTLRRDKDWLRAHAYLRPLKPSDRAAPKIGINAATYPGRSTLFSKLPPRSLRRA
jgi:hypothetical protein